MLGHTAMTWRQRSILIILLFAFALSLYFAHQAVGFGSAWFALLAMFSVLGVAAFSQSLFVIKVPRPFRVLRAWESTPRIYAMLCVPAFGQLVTRTPMRFLNRSVYLKEPMRDIANVCAQLEAAEAAHFWAGLLLLPYICFALLKRSWGAAVGLLLVEVVGNVYPILHLPLVRGAH
jgi:hypothetical protein